ncbi:GHKL domain-containing protein [Candidatus Woesebacteria bacterium]|nr:GHKL domain-containing protein [Candidatus Woesebacteria bacterium]
MFTSARIKLTFWYVTIVVLLTASLSTLFYLRTSQVISTEYERINLRMERENLGIRPPPGGPGLRQITSEDLMEAKEKIIRQLLMINLFVVGFFSIVGYWLTGITLKPIQNAHEAQKQFVGDAAHELRTPITALKTAIEVNLMDAKLPDLTKDILKENLEEVERLENLSEHLLQLAQVEGKKIILEKVRLQPLIQKVVKSAQKIAKQKQVEIIAKLPNDPLHANANEFLLEEAIYILIENAVKYSPKRSQITVELSQTKNHASITVSDSGPGIAQEELQHIFKRFYRIDSARQKQKRNGYGLGLAIAKSIVQQHHGKISVQSELGVGSSFSIILPTS